ncbi:uncharacterized protein LOC124278782 [Haliotis rubra]|uniref:uncharacterized protein LOC124278782 n=1 Tax=Haliotis rubra TaxID=36100 RepID=UPI001EE5C56A|nr:uncharacterized protein LOC124278782 [Haliotis rubra]
MGTVLNTINICVFCRKSMRSSTNAYLLASSISQLLYSLVMVPYTVRLVTYGNTTNLFSIMFGIYVANYVAVVLRRFTFIIACVVSMERFLVTTTPLKAKQYRLVHSPGQFIMGVSLFSVLVHIHSLVRNTVITNHKDGITTYSVCETGFYKNHVSVVTAWSTTARVLAVYLAITTALIFNIVVVISLRRQRQFRENITNARVVDKMKAREKQTTVTILVTNCLYLVLCVPMVTNSMAFDLSPVYGYFSHYYKNVYMVIQDLGSTCVLLGLSVDFFSHMMLSEMYRATFLCMFKPKCVAIPLTHSEYQLEDSKSDNFKSVSNVTLTSHL